MFAGFGVPFRQNGAYGPKANSMSGRQGRSSFRGRLT